MRFLEDHCEFKQLTIKLLSACEEFDCGKDDLNDFFLNASAAYSRDLLGKSYCFTLSSNPAIIVCAFTLSNDSIKMSHLPNARKKRVNKNVARLKQKNSYPAVIIGRLGVSKNFQGLNVGAELMDFIKAWFIDSGNKTGCRFVVVDAYNEERPIRYYQKCGFDFLIPDKTAELKYTRNTAIKDAVDLTEPKEEDAVFLDTRLMFFDLIRLRC